MAQLFLADVLLEATSDRAVLAQDPFHGSDTGSQCKLLFESLGSEAGLTAQPNGDAFVSGAGLVRAMVRSARAFAQRRGPSRSTRRFPGVCVIRIDSRAVLC